MDRFREIVSRAMGEKRFVTDIFRIPLRKVLQFFKKQNERRKGR